MGDQACQQVGHSGLSMSLRTFFPLPLLGLLLGAVQLHGEEEPPQAQKEALSLYHATTVAYTAIYSLLFGSTSLLSYALHRGGVTLSAAFTGLALYLLVGLALALLENLFLPPPSHGRTIEDVRPRLYPYKLVALFAGILGNGWIFCKAGAAAYGCKARAVAYGYALLVGFLLICLLEGGIFLLKYLQRARYRRERLLAKEIHRLREELMMAELTTEVGDWLEKTYKGARSIARSWMF